jgi:hypothetical protein
LAERLGTGALPLQSRPDQDLEWKEDLSNSGDAPDELAALGVGVNPVEGHQAVRSGA